MSPLPQRGSQRQGSTGGEQSLADGILLGVGWLLRCQGALGALALQLSEDRLVLSSACIQAI